MIPGSKRNHPTFWRSFGFALQGFRFAVTSERNIKVMLGGFAFAVVCGLFLEIDPVRWGVILLC